MSSNHNDNNNNNDNNYNGVLKMKPATLKFSLYYPSIDARHYDDIAQHVIKPIHELLCVNHFRLVTTEDRYDDVCKRVTGHIPNSPLLDPDSSLLMQSPILVKDKASTVDNIQWTSWTIMFYIMQLGQPLVDMTAIQSNSEISDVQNAEVGDMMNDVLELALQVSIMEGDFNERLQQNLPGAYVSLPGKEITTWRQIINPTMPPKRNNFSTSKIVFGRQSSMVSTAMLESHRMRKVGSIMLVVIIVLIIFLHKLGRRRRKQFERNYSNSKNKKPQQQQKLQQQQHQQQQLRNKKKNNQMMVRKNQIASSDASTVSNQCRLKWGTEDDVDSMLRLGKSEMTNESMNHDDKQQQQQISSNRQQNVVAVVPSNFMTA